MTIEFQRNLFSFQKGKETISYLILDHEIQTLRPITILDDGTKLILVYLPTEIITEHKNELIEKDFDQMAYFVIQKPDGIKTVLPYNHQELIENYKTSVIPSGFTTRWELLDFNKWMSDKKTDPKNLYELLKQTSEWLDYLIVAGLGSWTGIDYAIELAKEGGYYTKWDKYWEDYNE